MKSSIMTQSVGAGWGTTGMNMTRKKLLEWMLCTQAMPPNGKLCRVVDEPVGAHHILRAGNRIDLPRRSQRISVIWIYLQAISRFART